MRPNVRPRIVSLKRHELDRLSESNARLSRLLEDAREQHGTLAAQLAESHTTVEQGERQLDEADSRIAELTRQLGEKEHAIAHLTAELARAHSTRGQLAQTLSVAMSSRSWSATRPLRAISAYLRRIISPLIAANGERAAALEAVSQSGLFDRDYLVRQMPDGFSKQPLVDYLQGGELAHLDPHPLFDSSFYLEQHPELAGTHEPPLLHFLERAWHESGSCHPLFDAAFYRQQVSEGEPEVSPLQHYLDGGAHADLDPHPLFDTSFYRARMPDSLPARVNPLVHFVSTGAWESCDPHPLFHIAHYKSEAARLGVAVEENPLIHYLTKGASLGLDPSPLFSTCYYLERYPEVADSGINPLVHYVLAGAKEGRRPHALFDPAYYLEEAREVGEQGTNPLVHFLQHGHEKGTSAHRFVDLDFFFEAPEDAGLRARGIELAALEDLARSKRISFSRSNSPRVSVVIPVHNEILFTLQCLHSLSTASRDDLEVVVVDDGSSDATEELLPKIPHLRLLRNERAHGFLDAANAGARKARGDYLLLLNNDTVVTPGAIDALLSSFEEFPDAGAVGAKLLFGDGSLQEAGGIVWQDGSAWNYGRNGDPDDPRYGYAREVDYCSGSCLMIPRELFLDLGGFDRHFCPMYYEDTDLAFRVREAGKAVYYQPAAEVIHFEGATAGTDTRSGMKAYQVENQERFVERWRHTLADRPPNGFEPETSKDRGARHRALVVDHRMPTPDQDSGSVRMFNLLRALRDLGIKVTFVPDNLIPMGRYGRDLQRIGVEALWAPHVASLEDHLAVHGDSYDLVVLSRVGVASHLVDKVRKSCPKAFVVFDTVDLHHLRELRQAELLGDPELLKSARLKKYIELSVAHQADATVVVSPFEQELLQQEAPELSIHVVSNIHTLSREVSDFDERRDFFFIGGFEHPPNVDAAKWLVNDILPLVHRRLPDVHLYVIGSKTTPEVDGLASSSVTVTGYVDDLTPYLQGCRLSVAPLRYGAGVKGKVNQSMAHGVPCVATPIAAEGVHLSDGEDVLLGETPGQFAEAIVRLYTDRGLWKRLSQAGRRNVQRHFSFDAARQNLVSLLESATDSAFYFDDRECEPQTQSARARGKSA